MHTLCFRKVSCPSDKNSRQGLDHTYSPHFPTWHFFFRRNIPDHVIKVQRMASILSLVTAARQATGDKKATEFSDSCEDSEALSSVRLQHLGHLSHRSSTFEKQIMASTSKRNFSFELFSENTPVKAQKEFHPISKHHQSTSRTRRPSPPVTFITIMSSKSPRRSGPSTSSSVQEHLS